MKNLSIKPYQNSDLAEWQKYIRQAFHEKYVLGDEKFLSWQYKPGELLLAKLGDDIVGHFGFFDRQYKILNESKIVRVMANLFVLEPYRLSGIGAMLAQEVFNVTSPMLVSGYTPAAKKLYGHLRSKWRDAGNLRRWLAVLNPASELFSGLKLPARIYADTATDSQKIKLVNEIGGEFDVFWQKIRGRFPITIERTADYLRSRFLLHPILQYKIACVFSGDELRGYLIYRFEEATDFKIARIIDFVAEEAAEQPLLSYFLSEAKAATADAADFMMSGNFYDHSLSTLGFFDTTSTDFANLPIYFNPISYKKTFINIGYDIDASLEECYFTKADGDQDRPNPH